MKFVPSTGTNPRSFAIIALVVLLVLAGLATLPAGAATAAPPAPVVGAHPTAAPASPVPAAPRAAGGTHFSAYQNDSTISKVPFAQAECYPYARSTGCYVQAQDPTLVTLPNQQVGVGYSVLSTLNSTNFTECPSAPFTASRVAFAASPDNGSTFGSPVYLPPPAADCSYVQQLEPTFTVTGNDLWGAYIATNATTSQLILPAFSSTPPVVQWVDRTTDGIAIVNSTDNGTTWGSTLLVANGANFANPVLASYGQTLYLLYENISNGTTGLPLSGAPAADPIAEELLYSSDGGVTWNGPYTIPGENASQYNNTMGGSIAVNSNGSLAVAYATNRQCINYCFAGSYAASGDDIVDVTSTTNGTAWSAIHTIAPAQGEVTHPYGPCSQFSPTGSYLCALFEDAPMTSVAWGTGSHLDVAWEAAPFRNVTTSPVYYYNYNHAAIYAGGSNDGGVRWNWTEVSPPLSNLTDQQNLIDEQYFNPAIGFSNGTAYVTFSYVNWGELSGFQAFGNGYTVNSYSQWVATSTDGYHYTSPSLIYLSTRSDALAYYHDMGVHASVGFTAAGSPVFAYALADGWFLAYYPNTYDFVVTLSVSTAWTGPTTTVTFTETGLAMGTPWEFGLGGATYSTTAASYNVSGVPDGQQLVVSWPGTPTVLGYRALEEPEISVPTFTAFSSASTVWFNFTAFYGITFAPSPNDYYLEIEIGNTGPTMEYGYEFYWETNLYGGTVTYYTGGNAFPWYVPSNTSLHMSTTFTTPNEAYYYTQQFVGYWNGTGAGTYTGPGNAANLTVDSPFNETLWDLAVGTYSEQFSPVGLNSSSTYSFDLDGVSHSAAGTTSIVVSNLTTGSHSITNVSATSTTPGWSYFGQSEGGNPLLIPVVAQDNLTYSFVDASAPTGVVSFHGINVTSGSAWDLSFNGTTYSSSTPWINITSRPGTFAVGAFPVVSANGSSALTPQPFGPTLKVATGTSYDVNFTAANSVSVLRSAGGTVTPAGGSVWVPSNGATTISATPLSGYTWGGWSGIGPGAYTGMNLSATVRPLGPIQELASFVPQPLNRFNLTVNETGLPVGTLWTVYLGGVGYSSTAASFAIAQLYSCAVSGARGTYSVSVPALDASSGTQYFAAAGTPTTACVTHVLQIAYDVEYAVTVSQTAGGQVTGGDPSGINWIVANSSLALDVSVNSSFTFLGWVGTGLGSVTTTQASIVVSPEAPVGELAQFQARVVPPAPTYSVTFTAGATVPAGTNWSVTFNGSQYFGAAPNLVVSGIPNGTYSYSVSAVGGLSTGALYQPVVASGSTKVAGGPEPISVAFTASFWVSVTGIGPGTVSGAGWVVSGHSVTLNATPTGSANFVGWAGTGSGSYTGTEQGPTIVVSAPISEVASFASGPTGTTTGGSTTSPPSTALIAGLAIVGLVVGLAAGVVVARRGRPPADGGAP